MDSLTINQLAYDRIATEYARVNCNNSDQILNQGMSFKEIEGRWQILDMGCGPGNNFNQLLSVKPKKLTALDFSSGMLREAKARFGDNKIIEFVYSPYQTAQLSDRFDFIVANLALVNTEPERLPPVLSQVKNWLKKDGLFFANYYEGEDTVKTLTSTWGEIDGVKRVFGFYRQASLEKMYQTAGLEIIKIWKSDQEKNFRRINIFTANGPGK